MAENLALKTWGIITACYLPVLNHAQEEKNKKT